MEVKDIIKNRRIEMGMTMKELADKIGVSEGTISRWESGEIANMRRDKIMSLANALQISPAVIMEWNIDDNIISDEIPKNEFTSEEVILISKYRDLDLHGKDIVDTVLAKEHERCMATKTGEIPSWVPEPERYVFDRKKFEETIFGNNEGMAARNGKNKK